MMVTRRPAWAFSQQTARAGAGQTFRHGRAWKASASPTARPTPRRSAPPAPILDYLAETQKSSLGAHRPAAALPRLGHAGDRRGQPPQPGNHAARSATAAAKARCCGVLDRTVTAMGSRLLAEWLANPLTDVAAIDARLDAVGELVADAVAVRRSARDAAAGLRRRAAAGPRDHRPGQPARPELPRPHAAHRCRR